MEAQIKLGRLFGIQIGLHYSWLIIALLVAFSLAGHFGVMNSDWGTGAVWGTAIVTALLFFAAILVHELSHALVARMRGLPVRAITLFALGGVAQIEREAADAKTEFWMGIVGPITSAVIGFVCLALAAALGWSPAEGMMTAATPFLGMLVWLGCINIMLAAFNMIPGFPLDGGRVLRAIIWWTTGDASRSTRIAARVGQFVAVLLVVWGIFQFFGGAGFGGLWMAFIGWFLLDAARASYAHEVMTRTLQGVRVADVMAQDCPTIDGNTNVQTFVDEFLFKKGRRCFVVSEQGRVVGLVTPHEIKDVERAKWTLTTLDAVMRSLESLRTVTPETPVAEALELMGREDLNQLPLVRGGRLVSVVSRGHILQLFQTRAELNM